jgi:N-acetylmuramoyl-L-alanine amidase
MRQVILVLLLAACTAESIVSAPTSANAEVVPDPVWPEEGGQLRNPVIEVPPGFRRQTVFVVAGHGASGNEGNLGSWCTREQDFTLEAADALSALLDGTGRFDVVRARTGEQRPSYAARVRHLARSGATAMIELHSDARADALVANAVSEAGETCWRDDGEPGFTVLVRDIGAPAPLVAERLALARTLAEALAGAGFPAWVGDNYEGLYEADEVAGVWHDRRGLYMLRKPTVPSVIIETHNAFDGRETVRWSEPETHDTFGRAVLAGLIAYYTR